MIRGLSEHTHTVTGAAGGNKGKGKGKGDTNDQIASCCETLSAKESICLAMTNWQTDGMS